MTDKDFEFLEEKIDKVADDVKRILKEVKFCKSQYDHRYDAMCEEFIELRKRCGIEELAIPT